MITLKEMRKLEDLAEARGVSSLDLMENAGREFVEAVKKKFDLDGTRVVVFAGTGNNGGDGFVAARHFAKENPVLVLLFGDPKKLKEEAMKNFIKLENPINIIMVNSKEDLKQFHFQNDVNLLLIDALLGLGVQGEVREPVSLGVDLFNNTAGIKVAVDIPTGIKPETGEEAAKHCNVDFIVTFHDIKKGLEKWVDKTVIVDIGLTNPDTGKS
jgi:ADP-dependent NAD(P)H-hydrate dehydratase / NAD(P)H-hydrate epimerase